MIDNRLKSIYDRSPRLLQHVAVSAKGWRLKRKRRGGAFNNLLQDAIRRENYSTEELRQYRTDRLQQFLRTASESPYWRKRFEEYGVEPDSNKPFEQLEKLPILTKQEVKDAGGQIQPETIPDDDLIPCHTSGTTGSGLRFAQTKRAMREQWAVWWRYRKWHGLDLETWHGYFGGIPIVPINQSSPPFWRVNYPYHQVMFSSFHLKPRNAQHYVQGIRDHELPWLHGYPSSLALLGSQILDEGLDAPPTLRIATIGAETLFDHQREIISEAFGIPVRQHYGLAEAVANISECPEGNLHVDEDFAHVEFIPLENGEGHRIVGTNWTNPAFPLLRYDTGDIATLANESCSCGRPGRVIDSLLGRQDDYVVLPNGARVGRLDHIFKDFESVHEAQIYQPDREHVVFRIVAGDEYGDKIESALRENARSRLGEEIGIEFTYVDEINRTDNGKMKFVVSDIKTMRIEESDR
ncbi:phenylacetate--CoA ligase family protein [Haloglomus halophilum]|uniref:phenylacetate--CoA ligase family protein n=1 Tax=Haloglomus halophilum TaxID=2962672 RepID=UPI0020C9DD15|nr:hypothetical protein [Haloglomus halophilum]